MSTLTTQAIAETLGTVQLGVLFSTFLFGILFMQWVTYFTSKFNDGWTIRGLVYWIIILDITHVAISWEYLWMYTVSNFGNTATLYAAHWQYDSGPIFIVLTAAPTQFFLINRTRRMLALQHPYLANAIFAFTCTLGFVQVFMGLFMSGSLLALDASGSATTEGYTKFVPIAVAWESVAIATDMTVMISLVATLLYRRTGFRQTDWMVYNLILVAIECAFPVTLFTIGHITGVPYNSNPPTVCLVASALILNLNERKKLRRGHDGTGNSTFKFQELNFVTGKDRSAGRNMSGSRPQVGVDVTREEDYGMESMSNTGRDADLKPVASV
ncbi:hypothetical protein LENED_005095 [Lentinula edodes]|uniref:Uncharacterized protein n=1 Tax=Lentinula edodes TaxID=5353 RepID=A0A1Q3E7Z9_LENED|nr:hypothetical protein LENED_005095 [Lentinula edodes]